MKTYYVTFGGLLLNYHLTVQAVNKEIVKMWLFKRSKLGCWCDVVEEKPKQTKALSPKPEVLFYESAAHIH